MDFGRLPQQYHFSHSFCFFVHDLILQTIVEGEKADIFNIEIELDSNDVLLEMENKCGASLLDWMESKGYYDSVGLLYYKQIFAGLVSDFCHFVYEALSCAKKGKMTVAYALLRKPMKENLLLLEWLLSDPAELIMRFRGTNPKDLDPIKAGNDQLRKKIIREAMRNSFGNYWGTSDFIYELRYCKSTDVGFELPFQRANHLITTVGKIATERSNFNFIFSRIDAIETQWNHFYSLLPILLTHAFHIVEAISRTFARRVHQDDELIEFRVFSGFMLWMKEKYSPENWNETLTPITDLFSKALQCPQCSCSVSLHEDNLSLFFETYKVKCNCCSHELNLDPAQM